MSCPDIYIAPSYWTTPHTPEYGNTAIDVGAQGTMFTSGDSRTIRVTVRNHGTLNSPNSRLELFWADPSTSFTLKGQIDMSKFGSVDGGDGLGTDGEWPENFSWTPNSSVVATNGGHVCLLAQVQNESTLDGCAAQGHTASSSAATDARSAIRNIHVSAPAMMKKAFDLPGGAENGMSFAFAATDAGAHRGETALVVRALDPKKDRERLVQLAADPAVHHALACRRGKFALPEDVLVAEGAERVVLPRPTVTLRRGSKGLLRHMPRIGHLGTLGNDVAARLLPHGTKVREAKHPLTMNLAPGELRQVIVHVVPGKTEAFYAVAVDHVGPKDHAIGGLIMLFIPPPDLF